MQPAVRPPGQHVANVDGDAALDGIHGRPVHLRGIAGRAGIGAALQTRFAHALKQQGHIVPVGALHTYYMRSSSVVVCTQSQWV